MYTEKSMGLFLKKAASKDMKVDLTSAAVADASYVVISQVKLKRIAFVVSTATVSNVSIVLTFKQYPIVGSSANAVTLGTLTIPTAIVAGQVYYKDLSGTVLSPGQEVVCQVTTAAAGGGAAGGGYFGLEFDLDPETPANVASMVASA